MILLLEVLAVLAVVFGVAVVLTGRSDGMSDEGLDLADTGIPRDRAMTAQDVVGLRFALAFRGYRMSEVDDALDRLAAELAARDEQLARLRGGERAADDADGALADGALADDAPAEPLDPLAGAWADGPAYVPSDATGEVAPGTVVDVLAAPDAEEPQPDTPEFVEPLAAGEPEDEDEPEDDEDEDDAGWAEPPRVPDPLTDPLPPDPLPDPPLAAPTVATPSAFRPDVPDIPVPTYDPWSVTPRSRYTDGPTYVEVDHPGDDDDHVESITEHQTGHAPPPATGEEDGADEPDGADGADDLAGTYVMDDPRDRDDER